jgi:hypothetical protein
MVNYVDLVHMPHVRKYEFLPKFLKQKHFTSSVSHSSRLFNQNRSVETGDLRMHGWKTASLAISICSIHKLAMKLRRKPTLLERSVKILSNLYKMDAHNLLHDYFLIIIRILRSIESNMNGGTCGCS